MSLLSQVLVLLSFAVVAVPLAKRAGLSAVLGYLIAGVLIGPSGISLIANVESARHLAEFGVVFLLFLIGLELNPQRLWVMRRAVFGMGAMQVLLCALPIGLAALAFTSLSWRSALVVGVGLALSSTAFVMPMLAERRQLQTPHGQAAFSILLFQDLAVIPLLALVPLLSLAPPAATAPQHGRATTAALAAGVILLLVVASRYLVRPLFRVLSSTGANEVLTACALLIVVGTAVLMEKVGLSMSLGAFLAGVLLADSEYRHELQADIEPFKGLLLGLFFMTVGMGTNLSLLVAAPTLLLSATIAFMVLKVAAVYFVARKKRIDKAGARHMAFLLPQGGEFAFVLFSLAASYQLMSPGLADAFTVVVTLSMVLTPLFSLLDDKILSPRLDKEAPKPFDEIQSGEAHIIIAGLGRVGQIPARVLRTLKIPFTALDSDSEHVEGVRRFGNKLFYGDASRLDLLRSAGAEHARFFVLAIDDVEASMRTAEMVKHHFPHLEILARARNRAHAYKLMAMGINVVVRETFQSSLLLTEKLLVMNGMSEARAADTVKRFGDYDQTMLQTSFVHRDDEEKLIQHSKEAAAELESLFANDSMTTAEPTEATESRS